MQEMWLHQIWGNRLYESLTFEPHPCIPEGVTPIVIDPGRYNTNGGPDFSNLKLRIGPLTWAGNGEIHCQATDWLRPVSYTHLDVYKRQIARRSGTSLSRRQTSLLILIPVALAYDKLSYALFGLIL